MTRLAPFWEAADPEYSMGKLLMQAAQESRRRELDGQTSSPLVQEGIRRLGRIIELIRLARGASRIELAAQAEPRPFNPVFLMLLYLGDLRREELTDEVFAALSRLLGISEASLSWTVDVVEEVKEPQGIRRLVGGLLPQPANLMAPLRAFTAATAGGQLGTGDDGIRARREFGQTGIRVEYSWDEGLGLVVELSRYADDRRLPRRCRVSVVSPGGKVIAGPVECQQHVARFQGFPAPPGPEDRLVIEVG